MSHLDAATLEELKKLAESNRISDIIIDIDNAYKKLGGAKKVVI